MKTQLYKFEPFTQLFSIHTLSLVSERFFEVPPTEAKLPLKLTDSYYKAQYCPILFNYGLNGKNVHQPIKEEGRLAGTILVCITLNSNKYIPMHWPKILFEQYKCDLFWAPSTWLPTDNFFFGLCFSNEHRILMMIPETRFETEQNLHLI